MYSANISGSRREGTSSELQPMKPRSAGPSGRYYFYNLHELKYQAITHLHALFHVQWNLISGPAAGTLAALCCLWGHRQGCAITHAS